MQMRPLLGKKGVLRTVLLAAAAAVSLLAALRLISLRFTDTLPPAFAQAGGEVTITFADGLNLFSFPVEISPATDTCYELLGLLGASTDVESVSRFNTTTQLFESCRYSGAAATGTDLPIRNGEGYEVRMKTEKTVSFSGAPACSVVNLIPGLNLIGVPSPPMGLSCFDLLSMLGAEKAASIQRFNLDTGAFEACAFLNEDTPAGEDFTIASGEAYLMSMRQAVTGFDPNEQSRCQIGCQPPTISSIGPLSGPVGTPLTITGANLDCGTTRSLTCSGAPLVITSISSTQITSFIPPGAQDCRIALTTEGGTVTVPESLAFDVMLSRDFSLSVAPAESSVLQGSSTLYRVLASGADGFADLITLSVSGLPAGVTGSFFPETITAGQSSTLTLEAASDATITSASFTMTGTAPIEGVIVTRSAAAGVTVLAGGRTALAGQFRLTDGPPLAGVRLTFTELPGQPTMVTDSGGNFLFVDLPAGVQNLSVDASTATPADPDFPLNGVLPIYGMDVTVVEGQTTYLPAFQICPPPPPERFTPIQQSAAQDQVVTDPRFPGVSFTLPAGATLIGWDGVPKSQMGMERLTPDRLPMPPPPIPTNAVYQPFFGTPMGGLPSVPIPVTLPNDANLDPGEKVDIWYYDAAPFPGVPGAWRKAGTGTVSEDGTVVRSDEKLGDGSGDDDGVCETGEVCDGIERFCGVCGAVCIENKCQGGNCGNRNPDSPTGGDPVDTALGQMIVEKTDLLIAGRTPMVVQRTFNPFEAFGGTAGFTLSLGPGWSFSLDVVLLDLGGLLRLILPGNARFAFPRQPDGTFINRDHPRFAGAVFTAGTQGDHTLRFKDGTLWRFASGWRPITGGSVVLGVGLLVEQVNRNGNRLSIEREEHGRIARLVEPSGRALTFSVDAAFRTTQVTDPLGRAVRYGYDSSGQLETVTDPAGGVTRYTYEVIRTLPLVTGIETITDPKGIVFLRNEYSPNDSGRLVRQTLADGSVWLFRYEMWGRLACLGNIFSFLEDSITRISLGLTLCNAGSGLKLSPEAIAEYFARPPRKTTVVDPRGNETVYEPDVKEFARSITDPLGQRSAFERDAEGRVTSTTDSIGRTIHFTYDAAGNITSITDPAGNTRRFEYEPTFDRVTKIIDPLGNTTTFDYDSQGNLITITNPLGEITRFAHNVFGQPVSITDSLGNVTTLTYDDFGNLLALTDPLDNTVKYTYDAISRLIAQTDARGKTTRFAYDALNRITEVTDVQGGRTRFTYDANSNLLSITDPLHHTTAYEYDVMDRLVRRTDPLGASETFAYDAAGNLIRHTDRKGQVGAFTYDALNRRTQANYADGTTEFIYDAVGRLVQARDTVGGDILNSYDLLDRLIEQTTGLGSIQYAYDALSRRTSMSVLGQPPVNYNYDANSRLTRITQGSQSVDFDYDAASRRSRLTLPNGVSTEYRYDTASRLTELLYRNAAGVLGNLTYQYDPTGNRTRVGGSFARTLLPDPVASASYDAANRQLAFGDNAMTFDTNGNLTSITDPNGPTTFDWDAQDRLKGLTGPGTNAAFIYDAFGRRSEKQLNGQSTQYLYDGIDTIQEFTGGAPLNSLRSLDVDELLVRNGVEHVLADALGSTVALSNPAGAVQTAYTYEPFGRTAATGAVTNPFQYTGRENDGTGLYYYRARYYASRLHRFLSEDPLWFWQTGESLYAYSGNNPVNFIDPLGLEKGQKGGGPTPSPPQPPCVATGEGSFNCGSPSPPKPDPQGIICESSGEGPLRCQPRLYWDIERKNDCTFIANNGCVPNNPQTREPNLLESTFGRLKRWTRPEAPPDPRYPQRGAGGGSASPRG